MFARRFYLFLFCLIVIPAASIAAQNSPLIVTGSITDVKVNGERIRTLIDKNNEWGGYRSERKDPYFSVFVRLQYCNQGEVTLIVPTSGFFPNEKKKILFLEMPSAESKVSATVSGMDRFGPNDPMPQIIKEFEKPEPSKYSFAIIEPGQCYESGDTIYVKSGYKFETRQSGDRWKSEYEIVIPEHSYFKVQYSLSMKDSLLVDNAKRRWSKIGKLLTTSDSDFLFETEVIIDKLRD